MAPQRHAIRRQVIELRVSEAAEAHRLSPMIAALMLDQIVPILDRCFSEASDPDRVDRIDRLELDLGRLNPARLAEDMAARVEARLPAALRQVRPAVAGTMAADARSGNAPLLLVSQFAHTGGLPWWSDARKLDVLDEAVEAAYRAAPGALATLLRTLAADSRAIERLVLHQSEAGLERLLFLLAPAAAPLPGQLAPRLAEVPALAGIAPARLRQLLWREAFGAARDSAGSEQDLLTAMLTSLALVAGTTLALLLADLHAAVPARPDGPAGGLDAMIGTLAARFPPPPAPVSGTKADLAVLFAGRAPRAPTLGPLLELLRPLAAHLPAAERAACAAAREALLDTDIAGDDASVSRAIAALLRPFTRTALVTMAALRPVLAPLDRHIEAPARPPAIASLRAHDDEAARYVENAGLCLLWPFFTRFFTRLGLLAAGEVAFVSEAARHRAVGLLHLVATGEREIPEFWLDLNKVLCGLDLDAVEIFGPSVTEAEAAETEDLLAAAIAHAGCLGEITNDAFRGSFLLRRGVLGTRDGAWLLRVERQAADVLLERFPWRTEWIRLPWMPAPLRVEW